MYNIAMIGTGYVGLVTGTCFANSGNIVRCVDIDEEKIDKLNSGIMTIYEEGLEGMVKRNVAAERLFFTTNLKEAMDKSTLVFIAVGTPENTDGSHDLRYIFDVTEDIIKCMDDSYKLIVCKSTVPVGTTEEIERKIRGGGYTNFDIAMNPEFLKEGVAIADFRVPDRVVVGVKSEKAKEIIDKLYRPFTRRNNQRQFVRIPSAELIKIMSNKHLAARISISNLAANICDKTGADYEEVRKGIGSDSRIGDKFLYAGVGFGGSCFPKDVRALGHLAKKLDLDSSLPAAVLSMNERQKEVIVDKVKDYFCDPKLIKGTTIAILGLAFKPKTDDIREAPSLVVIDRLLTLGAKLRVYDPEAMDNIRAKFGDRLTYCKNMYDAVEKSRAIILLTEWEEFTNPDFSRIRRLMEFKPIIFDGRNQYDPAEVREAGFEYYGIGRR